MLYSSHNAATTVSAFVIALGIVLGVGWYARRRR